MRRRALLSGSVATLATLPATVRAQWVDCGGLVPTMVTNPEPCDPPSLDLTFMTPGTLNPAITFTRASTGTYFDSAGVMQTAAVNAPRWDYDPVTLQLRGLLIEEARTNLLLNSATLSTQSVTVTAVAYTLSFYGTGTVTKSGTATGALVGTGAAQRVSQTFTPTAGSLTLTVTGTVSNAQIETGAFATSYIPTTSAAVTRAVDVATMPTTGWINAPAGTLLFECLSLVPATSNNGQEFGSLNDGGGQNRLALQRAQTSNTIAGYIGIGGVTQYYANTGVMTPGSPVKAAMSYIAGNQRTAVNGGLLAGVGASALFSMTTLTMGSIVGVNFINGHIRRVSYWSRALSAAELQTVTTL